MCREHAANSTSTETGCYRPDITSKNIEHRKTLLLTPTSLSKVLALLDEPGAKDSSSSDRLFWLEGGSQNRSALAGLSTNFLSSMFNLSSLSAVNQNSASKLSINNDKKWQLSQQQNLCYSLKELTI